MEKEIQRIAKQIQRDAAIAFGCPIEEIPFDACLESARQQHIENVIEIRAKQIQIMEAEFNNCTIEEIPFDACLEFARNDYNKNIESQQKQATPVVKQKKQKQATPVAKQKKQKQATPVVKQKKQKQKYDRKAIMNRAWEIAREAAKKFGGKPSQYFNESLSQSHREYKSNMNKPLFSIGEILEIEWNTELENITGVKINGTLQGEITEDFGDIVFFDNDEHNVHLALSNGFPKEHYAQYQNVVFVG